MAENEPQKRPRGRPSRYGPKIVEEICDRIAAGESVRAICQSPGMVDKATVMRWLRIHDEFRDQYCRARELQIDVLVDEMKEIADSAGEDRLALAKAKLRIDARKWLITHLAPKKYGGYGSAARAAPRPIQVVISPEDAMLC